MSERTLFYLWFGLVTPVILLGIYGYKTWADSYEIDNMDYSVVRSELDRGNSYFKGLVEEAMKDGEISVGEYREMFTKNRDYIVKEHNREAKEKLREALR